jgi:glycerol-3-phosphate O-acyltransferase 3/4
MAPTCGAAAALTATPARIPNGDPGPRGAAAGRNQQGAGAGDSSAAIAPAPAMCSSTADAAVAARPAQQRPRSLSIVRAAEVSRVASEAVADLPDGFLFHADFSEGAARQELQARVEQGLIRSLKEASAAHQSPHARFAVNGYVESASCAELLFDAIPFVAEGVSDIVDDQFNQCFEVEPPKSWNWGYLLPFWVVGVLVRHVVLLPLRVCVVAIACAFLFLYFATLRLLGESTREREATCMTLFSKALLLAFGAVVTYHGVRPRSRGGRVYVANHTTMMDFVLLLGLHPFSVVAQLHSGIVGWFQLNVFSCLQCLWFDRKNANDRAHVRKMIQEHVANPDVPPLVIFPEGTCVNNKYLMQFKKGAFELDDVVVYPIAIRYNPEWAVAFWDSRREGFISYLLGLMMSWAVVVDIYFLPGETRRPDETPTAFAERVKTIIGRRADLISVPFDGYLKHIQPSERYVQERRRETAQGLLWRFGADVFDAPALSLRHDATKGTLRKR